MSERTPLLRRSSSSSSSSHDPPTPSPLHLLLPAVAALKAHKLPSTPQLLHLLDLSLSSTFFDDINGTIWDSAGAGYGSGRVGTGRLSAKGEEVRSSLRALGASLKVLLKERDEKDQWQELANWWRENEVRIDLPKDPIPSEPLKPTFYSTLQTTLTVLATSPELRSLLTDLVLLLRNIVDRELDEREEELGDVGKIGKVLVDELAEKVTGETEGKGKGKENEKEGFSGESKEEMRDEILARLKETLEGVQRNPSFRHSIHTFVTLLTSFSTSILSYHPSMSSQTLPPIELLNDFLEPFLGNPHAAQPLFNATTSLREHFREENLALKEITDDAGTIVEQVLTEPEYVGTRESNQALGALQSKFEKLLRSDPLFKESLSTFLRHLIEVVSTLWNDVLLRDFANKVGEVGVATSAWGKEAVRTLRIDGEVGIWGDVVEWVVPRLVAMVAEMGLPRIEFASDEIDLAIDAPPFLHTAIVPDKISFSTHSTYELIPSSSPLAPLSSTEIEFKPTAPPRLSNVSTDDVSSPVGEADPNPFGINPPPPPPPEPRPISTKSYKHETTIILEGLRLSTREIGYFFCWRGLGCLEFTERGALDIYFGGGNGKEAGGIDVRVGLDFDSTLQDGGRLFSVTASEVRLQDFDFRPHKSSHPILMWCLRPVLRRVLKIVLEKVLKAQVESLLEKVGEVGGKVKREREKAAEQGEVASSWWSWLWAGWKVGVTGGEEEKNEEEEEEDVEEEEPVNDQDECVNVNPSPEEEEEGPKVHLSGKGVTMDVGPGTVGVGAEGVAITTEDSSTPQAVPSHQQSTHANGVGGSISEAIEDGQKAAKKVVDGLEEIGEEVEEFPELVAEERKEDGWRSEAFDF